MINRVKIPISNAGMIFLQYSKKRKICLGITVITLPQYKNQPAKLRNKAVEIENALLEEGVPEGVAIATGLKRAREVLSLKLARSHPKEPRQSKPVESRNEDCDLQH